MYYAVGIEQGVASVSIIHWSTVVFWDVMTSRSVLTDVSKAHISSHARSQKSWTIRTQAICSSETSGKPRDAASHPGRAQSPITPQRTPKNSQRWKFSDNRRFTIEPVGRDNSNVALGTSLRIGHMWVKDVRCASVTLMCSLTYVHAGRITYLSQTISTSCEPGSVVGIATCYGLDGPGIESRWGRDFPHLSRPALGPTQPPVQWVPGLSRGKERPGRDADPSPLSSVVVKTG